MRTCVFYSDTGIKKQLGRIFLQNGGVLSFDITPGNELAMGKIINEPVMIRSNRKLVTKEEDPVLWFENLPLWYQGTYLWAEIQGPRSAGAVLKGLK